MLACESFKLFMALVGLRSVKDGYAMLRALTPRKIALYAVPGLLYAFNNNLYLMLLSWVPPASFAALLHTRALWAGLMYKILGRPMSGRQWVGLTLLASGTSLAQYATAGKEEDNLAENSGASIAVAMTPAGLMAASLYAFISAFAGVFGELLLKSQASLHVANVPLYSWGVIFNAMMLFGGDHTVAVESGVLDASASGSMETDPLGSFASSEAAAESWIDEGGVWRGWDLPSTYLVMVLMATSGYAHGYVTREYGFIVKTMAIAASNVLVYILSVALFGAPLALGFIFGAGILFTGVVLYHTAPKAVAEVTATKKSDVSGDANA